MRPSRPGLFAALLCLVLPVSAIAHDGAPKADRGLLDGPLGQIAQATGPDFLASDNVELVNTFRPATGLTAGARVVGNRLFVTSSKDLEIFDITKPESPALIGAVTVNVQFENEEVPTNGKLLGISSDLLHSSPQCLAAADQGGLPADGGCLRLYDVRNPAGVKELDPVPGAGDHTSTCILDCAFLYGSSGSIVDARAALTTGKSVKLRERWTDVVQAQAGKFIEGCHNVNEVRPGIIITACQPSAVLSVLPEDGGSITNPKVLFTGRSKKEVDQFIHSARWPRAGRDKFVLIGGERNFVPQCDPTVSAFQTFDASRINETKTFTPIDEIRPVNGSFLDSNPPAQVLGCSVHWFEEHPTFRDGGLVALAEYENGTRFLQIMPSGKIIEQGYFIPLGGSTSAPHWAPNSNILYAIDYERGIDVLRYKGSLYVPDEKGNVPLEPGAVPGTEGRQPDQLQPPAAGAKAPTTTTAMGVCASDAGFERATVSPDDEEGQPAAGLRFLVKRRQQRSFDVDIFQQSSGRRVTGELRVARFRNRKGTFTWKGRKSLADGFYFARFTMKLPGGVKDIRRVTLRRSGGRFSNAPAFYARDTCGALRSYKLERPVFDQSGLGIAYRLTRGVDSVSVVALRGNKVLKRFKGLGTEGGRTYRLKLPAAAVARGASVRIRIEIVRAGTRVTSTLTSRRL